MCFPLTKQQHGQIHISNKRNWVFYWEFYNDETACLPFLSPYVRPSIHPSVYPMLFLSRKMAFFRSFLEFLLFLLFCYVLASLSMGVSIFMSVHPYIRPSVGILVHRKPNVEIDMQGLTNISRDIQMETRKEHRVYIRCTNFIVTHCIIDYDDI